MNLNYVSNTINLFLSRPYPLVLIQKYHWLYVCFVAIIIALLINLQQPFGLHAWAHPYKWAILCGFGGTYALVKTALYLIFPRIFPELFSHSNWTMGKEIRLILFLFISMGILNWGYAFKNIPFINASWHSFFQMQFYTFVFGLGPAITSVLIVQIRNFNGEKQQKAESIEMNADGQNVTDKTGIIPISGKPFNVHDILYIKASQNYVEIHFISNGNKQKHMCRTTIKLLETLLGAYPQFERCHKSYLVNIERVTTWKGNAGKMMLQMEHYTEKVPVSRKFVPLVKEILSSYK